MFIIEFVFIWGLLLILSGLAIGITDISAVGVLMAGVPLLIIWAVGEWRLKQESILLDETIAALADKIPKEYEQQYLKGYHDGYYDCLRKIKQDGEKK